MTLSEYQTLINQRAEVMRKLLPLMPKARDLARAAIGPDAVLVSVDLCLDHIAVTYKDAGGTDTEILPLDGLL